MLWEGSELFDRTSFYVHDLWALYFVHLRRCWCMKAFYILMIKMLFSRTVDTPVENKLFTWTANIYFTAMERWEQLHPVGLVCSTLWNMQWAREDWVAVHRFSNKLIGQVGHGEFRRSLSSGFVLNFQLSETTPGRAQSYSLWKTCVLSLVLKTKSRKIVYNRNTL